MGYDLKLRVWRGNEHDGESVTLNPQPLPPMPDDLKKFFEGA